MLAIGDSVQPLSIAGFNLGEYASTSLTDESRTIDVYANRQLEQALEQSSGGEQSRFASRHRCALRPSQRAQPLGSAASAAQPRRHAEAARQRDRFFHPLL